MKTRELREITVTIELDALGDEAVGVRGEHVFVVPADVVPAEVVHDEQQDLQRQRGSDEWLGREKGGRAPEEEECARVA